MWTFLRSSHRRFTQSLRLRHSTAPHWLISDPQPQISLQNRLRVRPLTSDLPVADPMFYPHLRHRRITGTGLYDYYGFLFRPPSHHSQRYRAAQGLRCRSYTDPGSTALLRVSYPPLSSPTYLLYVQGLRGEYRASVVDGTSPAPGRLTEGSLSLRWRFWTPASFGSLIGTRAAPSLAFPPP